jgi:hypothetical protein
MTDVSEKVASEIGRLSLPPSIWKTCTTCRAMRPEDDPISWDWMNLRPCPYFLGGQKAFAEVCVDCAESVQLFPWLSERFPIPDASVDIDTSRTYARGGSYLRPCAFVEGGGMKFMVTSSGNYKMHVRRMGTSDPLQEYDNTFQAWLAIKAKIEKGDDPVIGNDWGERPAVATRKRNSVIPFGRKELL